MYVGTWRSSFALHTEDCELYSINYQHFGEPKYWYCIPPCYADQIDGLVEEERKKYDCTNYMRHKLHIFSLELLENHQIPYYKVSILSFSCKGHSSSSTVGPFARFILD